MSPRNPQVSLSLVERRTRSTDAPVAPTRRARDPRKHGQISPPARLEFEIENSSLGSILAPGHVIVDPPERPQGGEGSHISPGLSHRFPLLWWRHRLPGRGHDLTKISGNACPTRFQNSLPMSRLVKSRYCLGNLRHLRQYLELPDTTRLSLSDFQRLCMIPVAHMPPSISSA